VLLCLVAVTHSTQDTKTEVVLDILHSIAESENFFVPYVRRDNAKELATEMLRKVGRARVEGILVVSMRGRMQCKLTNRGERIHRGILQVLFFIGR